MPSKTKPNKLLYRITLQKMGYPNKEIYTQAYSVTQAIRFAKKRYPSYEVKQVNHG